MKNSKTEINPFELLEKNAGSIFETISLSSHFVWWSSADSKLLMGNRAFLGYSGFSNLDQMVGSPYGDVPSEAGEMPEIWIEQDQMTMQSRNEIQLISYLKPANSNDRLLLFCVKNPVFNGEGQPIGTINHCFDVSNNGTLAWLPILSEHHDLCFSGKGNQAFTYTLTDQYKSKGSGICLTSRQAECLFLLLRGKTSREIAAILGRSKRTVEDHIDNVKAKFGCDTRSQLIEEALDEGFLNLIPKSSLPSILKLVQKQNSGGML